jgi:hypothetical protein
MSGWLEKRFSFTVALNVSNPLHSYFYVFSKLYQAAAFFLLPSRGDSGSLIRNRRFIYPPAYGNII